MKGSQRVLWVRLQSLLFPAAAGTALWLFLSAHRALGAISQAPVWPDPSLGWGGGNLLSSLWSLCCFIKLGKNLSFSRHLGTLDSPWFKDPVDQRNTPNCSNPRNSLQKKKNAMNQGRMPVNSAAFWINGMGNTELSLYHVLEQPWPWDLFIATAPSIGVPHPPQWNTCQHIVII